MDYDVGDMLESLFGGTVATAIVAAESAEVPEAAELPPPAVALPTMIVDTEGRQPAEVAEDVRRNVEALMPGGGYVFNNVHNIQGEVPPENIVALFDTAYDCGFYD